MRPRFLVLLLVGLLPSLFLRCGASTQTPAPAPPLPASIQTPAPAPPPISAPTPVQSPPVEDKVEVRFDRFENSTTVIFPSIRQLVPRAKKQLTPVWFASFRGQTPPPPCSSPFGNLIKPGNTYAATLSPYSPTALRCACLLRSTRALSNRTT